MNILLLQPHYNFAVSYTECPAGSLILLGTMAEQAGHKVRVLHLDADDIDLKQEILSFKPDILGITMDTFHTLSAKEVLKLTRSISEDIYTVIGGPHPSALKEKCYDDFPNADAIIYGEGEFAFMELLGDKPEPRNCLLRGHNNGLKPVVYSPDLDHLPLPNYDLIDMPRYARFRGFIVNGGMPMFYVMAARGCPYNCTFCASKTIWGRHVRLRKPEAIVDEVEYLIDKYGAKEIFFQDDTFNIDLNWAMEIFDLIIKGGLNKKSLFRIVCRADEKLITREFLQLAKKANVWLIFFGVESGNQAMVDSMNKGLKLDDVRRAFRLCHDVGIEIQASFVLGMPGETRETVEDTRKFIQETQPEYYGCTLVTPLPGTVLEKQLLAEGHLLKTSYDNYAMGLPLVRTDTLSRADLYKISKELNSGVGV